MQSLAYCNNLFLFQVMYLQAFILVLLVGKILRKIFFGQLRPAEFEVMKKQKTFIKFIYTVGNYFQLTWNNNSVCLN